MGAALSAIDEWPVANAAAAVFGPDELLDQHGDLHRSFPLASVSKVLFALAVHVAVEEGSVDLDDEVTGVGGPPGATVRHLLAHASGLPPDGERTPLGPPERRRVYSNVGFEVLGEHLAAATGMPTTEYVRLALVAGLGLDGTNVEGSPAHGYSSTCGDLCALLQAVVGGRLLAPETLASMTTPAFPDLAGVLPGFGRQDPNPWGLGVELRGHKSPHWTAAGNSPRTWGHFGQTGTFVWWDPDADDGRGLGLVVLTERAFGTWAIEAWPDLASAVLDDHGGTGGTGGTGGPT